MSLLRVSALSAHYGDFQALFEVNVAIERGETVAIIGANGAGKTTFLSSVMGVLPAARDCIVFDGRPIGGRPANDVVRAGIALVPEGRRLFPSCSVEENLLLGAYTARTGYWRLDSVYDLFPELADKRDAPATSLSGGQQQMAAIGRALMSNPQLILFDEISLGLAPTVIKRIYEALPRIISEDMTAVIVEQDLNQALAVADRVYCFQEGRVSLEGRPGELTRDQISLAYFGV